MINLKNLGNFKMTALRKFKSETASNHTDIMGGEHVEMYTSGAALKSSGMETGDLTALFTSGASAQTTLHPKIQCPR
jgi:hypothetical protein